MAGTTTNFAIPYPSSTDYVTDGATAMKSLADQVDAAMFTGASAGNLLINGAMQVSQRLAVGTPSSAFTTGGYFSADRFYTSINTLGTWVQTTAVNAPAGSGFCNSLKMDCTVASASPAAGASLRIEQALEGQNLQAIRKGTASAKTLTLSFWVSSFQTGTFICELVDNDNSRAVSKSYTVNASNTWEYKTITFPADTTGAFDNDSNLSISVNWWLGAGSNFTSGTLQTTWGTTTSANRAVGQTNCALADTGLWYITGAQLTVGSVATPFEFKSYADDLCACQRYYWRSTLQTTNVYFTPFNNVAYTANSVDAVILFPVTMRAKPTAFEYASLLLTDDIGVDVSSAVPRTLAANGQSLHTAVVTIDKTSGFTQRYYYALYATAAAAYIAVSAEL